MKLIEVVIGKQTSDETKERALFFARQIGKLPVVVRDSPGFLVNRVLFPYLLDAAEIFEKGVDAKEIDDALVEWGMPMGPLRLIDEIGVDITVDIAATLEKSLGARARTPAILQKMREAKLLGRKTGSGFYKYEGKTQSPNEAIGQWRQPANAGNVPHNLALPLIYLMVNEAARCLEEKVVATPEDADYGMILGTGFAPLRGGPLRFADHFGISKMVARAAGNHGGKFAPCAICSRQHAKNRTRNFMKTPLDAPEKQIAAETSAKPPRAGSAIRHRHLENVGGQSRRARSRRKLARSAR